MDWPGRIASVVFLPGCSFACGWCHNRVLVNTPDKLDDIPVDQVLIRVRELGAWVDGIVVTGGEPTIHPDLPDLIRTLKTAAPVKLDTNGSRPDMLEKLLAEKLLDGVSMDIKAPLDADHYSRVVEVPVDIDDIRRSIQLILESGVWYEFRTTLLPTLHTPGDVALIRQQLKQIAGAPLIRPLKLQAFKPHEDLPEPWRSMPEMDIGKF